MWCILRLALLRFTFRCMLDFLSYVSAHACVGNKLLGIIVVNTISTHSALVFVYILSFRVLRVCEV